MKTPRLWLICLFVLLASTARADLVCVQNNMCCAAAAGGGVSASSNTAWTGTNSFVDGNFSIVGSGNPAKIAQFEVDGLAAGTHVFTVPPATTNDTLAALSTTQTFLAMQTFQFGATVTGNDLSIANNQAISFPATSVANNRILVRLEQTPDTALLVTGSTANSWIIAETADSTNDFAHPLQANPTVFWQGATPSTTRWGSVAFDDTDFVLGSGAGDLKLTPAGHVKMTGTAPAVSACGTSPSVVAGSDTTGTLTTGSGGAMQSCTLTFAVAFSAIPKCFANNQTSFVMIRAIPTTTTVTFDVSVAGTLASVLFDYYCTQGV